MIHGVQHVFHPPATLAAWPDADHRTRLVFIVNDIEPRAIEDLFNAFLGVAQARPARPRRADRQSADAVRRRGSFALERSSSNRYRDWASSAALADKRDARVAYP